VERQRIFSPQQAANSLENNESPTA